MPPAIAAFAASKATSALYASEKYNVSLHNQTAKSIIEHGCDFRELVLCYNIKIEFSHYRHKTWRNLVPLKRKGQKERTKKKLRILDIL